ncbi:MAG: nucleoside-diphosphate sugar epimerase/dehydratase [Chlorobiaceae bacterium]
MVNYLSFIYRQAISIINSNYVELAILGIKKRLLELPLRSKRIIQFVIDIVSGFISLWLAFYIRLDVWQLPEGKQWILYLVAPVFILPIFIYLGLYRTVYRYSGVNVFISLFRAVTLYGVVFICIIYIINIPNVPRSIAILHPIIFLLMTGGVRTFPMIWFNESKLSKKNILLPKPLIIYGAGSAGVDIANEISRNSKYYLVGFFDDNQDLHGRFINGKPIFKSEDAGTLIEKLGIKIILIAMPSATRAQRNKIIKQFLNHQVQIQVLPGVEALADGRVTISDIKEVEIDDLLGRESVSVDHTFLHKLIGGKVVMVTGAGGSIGSELCHQIHAAQPAKLLLVDHAEYNLYMVHNTLENSNSQFSFNTHLVPLLSDVVDEQRMREICRIYKPDIIYHAAAYKHVPMVEHNPINGVRNNVFGTLSMVHAALDNGVKDFVLVSTDKAVRPTSIMGASKRICELILQAFANQKTSTCFSMVRFGNVLGSSGSVLPFFRNQIKMGGPVTITHKEVTRYFMTITEAAQLVIEAGAMAKGGEVFLLDMGEPVKIIHLARRMIELSGLSIRDTDNPNGDIEIVVTGLRPGEKLYEELLIASDPEPTRHPRIFKAHEYSISMPELIAHLSELQYVIESHNDEAITICLKKLVKGFKKQEEVKRKKIIKSVTAMSPSQSEITFS